MGVTAQTYQYILPFLKDVKSICDLGDQQFMSCPPFKEMSHTRDYFIEAGYNYVSIDLNGLGGSHKIDLDKEIKKEDYFFLVDFDLVLDLGTLEHVRNLYTGLKNVHNLCKVNGLMIHIVPSPNHWPLHGFNYMSTDFFYELAKTCNYEILDNSQRPTLIGGSDSDQTYAVLKKLENNNFLTEEEFIKLPLKNK